MHLQESGEMYLETILILSRNGAVRSLDVAEYMGFSKPSVSRAVGLLKNGGYIRVDGDGYITLTAEGHEIADKIYERHTVLAEFLTKLGVDPKIAVQDACKIEHDISDESFDAIKKTRDERKTSEKRLNGRTQNHTDGKTEQKIKPSAFLRRAFHFGYTDY